MVSAAISLAKGAVGILATMRIVLVAKSPLNGWDGCQNRQLRGLRDEKNSCGIAAIIGDVAAGL